jgi:epoxide hydrolase-like predicted phosphatase
VPARAVIFDIGGVLEVNPETGWQGRWAQRLAISEAALGAQLEPIWTLGATGEATLDEIERRTAAALHLDATQLAAFMADAWDEYLGTLNVELATYFAGLRPRYRTAILSNSFVGARECEHTSYGFADMCDLVVYSHEEGVGKPDPRAYAIVCDRLGVRPADAVLLDDTPACVDGALMTGLAAVRFVDCAQAMADLTRLLEADRR